MSFQEDIRDSNKIQIGNPGSLLALKVNQIQKNMGLLQTTCSSWMAWKLSIAAKGLGAKKNMQRMSAKHAVHKEL